MKKIFLLLVVILCISTHAKAQLVPQRIFLGGYLGPQMYTTYGGGSSFHFGLEAGNTVAKDIDIVGNIGAILEKYGKTFDLTLNARAFTASGPTVQLFGELGGGAYIFTYSGGGGSRSQSQTYLGVNIGLGGKVVMDKGTDLIIKAKFHNPFFNGGSFNWINLTAGIDFTI